MKHNIQIPRGLSIQPPENRRPITPQQSTSVPNFDQFLIGELGKGELKFSAHAEKRLAASCVDLSQVQRETLSKAVDKAAQKGSRDTLILMDNMAFVVSVKNKTVITVVDGERMKENVFTQIDSAVLT